MTLDEFNEIARDSDWICMTDILDLMDEYGYSHTIVSDDRYEEIMMEEFQSRLYNSSLNEFISFVSGQVYSNEHYYFIECDDVDQESLYVGIDSYDYDKIISEFREYLIDGGYLDDEDDEDDEDEYRSYKVNDSAHRINSGETYSTYKERKNQRKLSMLKRVESLI